MTKPTADQVQNLFRPQLESVPLARHWARQLVADGWGLPDGLAGDVELVVAELTSNAVRHAPHSRATMARGFLVVLAREARGGVRVEVHDAGDERPRVRTPGDDQERGRGLCIVEALTHTWGTSPRLPFGKIVWALLGDPAA
ncbi:ATP-binding protein [Streptomyces sp. H10-C2]|uniref:ATP-binding protein n=1 Tax=unclassified Streptomyces TaxID=2593676 RepID=UPI0024BB9716|nr:MULTISPECIES: ATP-binding protein [unclassified Streptomyces]MDJ0344322.1 ATP-binding protein [Streptomyces sp. PH10-H1]MDJ0373691.1 ATP-binding protein [Streptomyces sp. H10-C2]